MSDEDLIRRGAAIQLMARVYAARTRIKDALEELHAMPAVVPGGWLSFDSAPRDVLAEAEEMADMLLKQHDAFSGRAADTIHTLLAIIAAQEAQIKGLEKDRDRRTEMHECAMSERDDATLYADEQKARAEAAETALAAERAKVAKLVEAGKRVLAPLDEPCRHDHHGYCQAHFIEADCSVAALRAAITEEGQ